MAENAAGVRRHDAGRAAGRGAGPSRRVFDVSKPWLNRVIEGERKAYLKAVTGVSFAIGRRETLALVGESGSGKSTVARMIGRACCGPTAGSVTIDGIDMWAPARGAERQKLRRRLQMIFQDPFASLNPRWRVEPHHRRSRSRPSGWPRTAAEIEASRGRAAALWSGSTRPTAPSTRTSSPAASASASASRARCRRTRVHRLRRADQRARRVGAGADPQPDARPAGPARASPTCSSATTWRWCGTWRRASASCIWAASSRWRRRQSCSSARATPTRAC